MISKTFIVASDFSEKKLKKLLQPDYSLLTKEDENQPAILLDTFDEDLRNRGQLLLEMENELLFIDTKNSIVVSQSGTAKLLCKSEIKNGPVKEMLSKVSKLRAFLPISSISYHRATRIMLDDVGKTVARLHFFSLNKKKRTAHIIVSQPLRGYNEEHNILIDAMTELSADDSCAYNLLKVEKSNYTIKPEIKLSKSASIKDTANTIISTFIEVARKNETGIRDDHDTEFLHDYRVAFRKVRSVISLFKGVYSQETTDYLKEEFAALMQVTGRLRDLDVYLLDKEHYFSLVPNSTHEGLELMFSSFEEERLQKHKLICATLTNKKYKKGIVALQERFVKDLWENGPKATGNSHIFACKVIMKRYVKVCAIARTIDDSTDDEIIHELRIHCKKLRYLMEFFTPLFTRKKIKYLIKSLKILQDNLGDFNDYSVQQESLAAFLKTNPFRGEKGMKVAESIGALTAMLNLLQQQEKSKVMANFASFDSAETRELFDSLFTKEG